jgi:hypothetical protein
MSKPIQKFSDGQVSCAIWENEVDVRGRQVVLLKASLERRYTDRTGAWRSSNSFSRREIPQAVYCLMRAYAMMTEHSLSEEEEDAAE